MPQPLCDCPHYGESQEYLITHSQKILRFDQDNRRGVVMWSISALRVMSLGQTMISKVIIKKIYKWLSLKNHHTGSTALISTLLLKTPICEVAAKIDPAPQRLDKFGLTFDLGRTNSINLRSKQ